MFKKTTNDANYSHIFQHTELFSFYRYLLASTIKDICAFYIQWCSSETSFTSIRTNNKQKILDHNQITIHLMQHTCIYKVLYEMQTHVVIMMCDVKHNLTNNNNLLPQNLIILSHWCTHILVRGSTNAIFFQCRLVIILKYLFSLNNIRFMIL